MFQLYGNTLYEAMQSFCNKDYARTVELLYPIRYELSKGLGGSHAQVDLVAQILTVAALKCNSSNTTSFNTAEIAKQLVVERVGREAEAAKKTSNPDDLLSFNERITNFLHQVVN